MLVQWISVCSNVAYSVDFHGNCICKYHTHAKCLHSFQTPAYVVSMKLHPQEVPAANAKDVVMEHPMFKRKR